MRGRARGANGGKMGKISTNSVQSRRIRAILRAGSALPLLASAAALTNSALANPIVENSTGDITVAEASATGAATAVQLTSSGGTIQADVTTTTATSTPAAGGNVIHLITTGSGAISGSFDTVNVSGTGGTVGVYAQTDDGDITLDVGTINSTGAWSGGVQAFSDNGDIVITAGSVTANGTGIDPNFVVFPEAIVGVSAGGAVSVTADQAETYGQFGSAVIAQAGTDALVNIGTAINHHQGTTVSASGANSAIIRAGSVTATDSGATAVAISSARSTRVEVSDVDSAGRGIYATLGNTSNVLLVGNVSAANDAITLRNNTSAFAPLTLDIVGDVAGNGGRGVLLYVRSPNASGSGVSGTVNIAAGASVTGSTAAFGFDGRVNNTQPLPAFLRSTGPVINNSGTITGASGTAIALGQVSGVINNRGTINGDVVLGGGSVLNRGGTINGSVIMNGAAGTPLNVFGYEGTSTGVTGTISGTVAAVDTFAQIFSTSGTGIIGGGLPTAFDRYGVFTESRDTVVTLEQAAIPVGPTPSLLVIGPGAVINRADLAGTVVNGMPVAALTNLDFGLVGTPFGPVARFEGGGVSGPASFVNEADIAGRIALTTGAFTNSGTITRSSAAVPSAITARLGEAFTFINSGTIGMTDDGTRVVAPNPNPFADFNPYGLPEPAMIIRSAATGTPDAAGYYNAANVTNTGAINGGLLVRMSASSLTITNEGTITAFAGNADAEPALAIGSASNWDAGVGSQQAYQPPFTAESERISLINTGTIDGGVAGYVRALVLDVVNGGTITSSDVDEAAFEIEREADMAGDGLLSFVSTGTITGAGRGVNLDSDADIVIDIASVTAGNGQALTAETGDEGGIVANVDSASAAGLNGHAVRLETETGDITLTAGSLATTGNGGIGALAESDSGNVSLTVENVATTGLALGAYSSDGVVGLSQTGSVTLNVGSATTEGIYTSAVAASGGAGASVTIGSASSAGAQGAVVYATSTGGDVQIDAGTITLRGTDQAAINAIADTGTATVVVDQIINEAVNGKGVYASAATVDVTAGTIQARDYGIRGVGLNGGAVTITTTGNISAVDRAIRANGGAVSITTAAERTVSGATAAIMVEQSSSATVTNLGTALAGANLGSAIRVNSTGAIAIESAGAVLTGAGADPGINPNTNLRNPQGGIVALTSAGPVTIDAGLVDVTGEYRYGVFVGTPGAVTVTADEVNLASADSAAVAVRGGAGNVSITTGRVTTTGASGAGVVAFTSTGAITLDAGVTRTLGTGQQGPFTGDAVFAQSASGVVSVTSEDSVAAGAGASAVAAISGGNVSIASGFAGSSGDDTATVFGQSNAGTLTIDAQSVAADGARSMGVQAFAFNGLADIRVGNVSATGLEGNAVQAVARQIDLAVDGTVTASQFGVLAVGGARTDVVVDGDVTAEGVGVIANAQGAVNVTINGSTNATIAAGLISLSTNGNVQVAEGASVTGAGGIALYGQPGGGIFRVSNSGTITAADAAGAAIVGGKQDPAHVAARFLIRNDGVLRTASGTAITTDAGNDLVELTDRSDIAGLIDLGAGEDELLLSFNEGATTGEGQVAASSNVELLTVENGTWRATATQSFFDQIVIEQGATLIVGDDADGFEAVGADFVHVDGQINYAVAGNQQPIEATATFTGAGSVHLTGPATIAITDGALFGHTGGTFIENGKAVLTSAMTGNLSTSGAGVFELAEGGDFTGNLVNDGSFLFSQAGDYDFLGDFSGAGLLEKQGAGRLTFAGLYGFTGTTTVLGGSVAFTGQLAEDTRLDLSGGSIDLSQVDGGEQTVAELSGDGGTVELGETALIIEQMGNTVFSGSITGMGELIKEGEGDLKLNGDSEFAGTATVNDGILSVNGDIPNAEFVVNEGGQLGGNGTVGETQINTGGTLAPGNSIGRLSVNGDIAFTAGSIYEVEVNAAGQSDRTDATGRATLGGAVVQVIGESGTYRALTDYTILTAAGGVSGTFGSVTDNLAFVDPYLIYSPTAVTLRLARNDVDFAALGQTANQRAIGALIDSYGYGNALYNETLTLVAADVAPSFGSLAGEVYPALGSGLVETAELLRRQVDPVARGADEGVGPRMWAAALANRVSGNGAGAAASDGTGVAGGFGFGSEEATLAIGAGKLDQEGAAIDDGDVTFAVAQLGMTAGALRFTGSMQFGWTEASLRRSPVLGTLAQSTRGAANGEYQLFSSELGYAFAGGGLMVQPFVGVSAISLDMDGVTEAGGPTALVVRPGNRKVGFGRLGARAEGAFGPLRLSATGAYRRAWGEREGVAQVGFAGGPQSARITAAGVARTGAEIDVGIDYRLGLISIEAGYNGLISNGFDAHGGKVGVKFRF